MPQLYKFKHGGQDHYICSAKHKSPIDANLFNSIGIDVGVCESMEFVSGNVYLDESCLDDFVLLFEKIFTSPTVTFSINKFRAIQQLYSFNSTNEFRAIVGNLTITWKEELYAYITEQIKLVPTEIKSVNLTVSTQQITCTIMYKSIAGTDQVFYKTIPVDES